MTLRRLGNLLVASAAVLALAACGGGDGGAGPIPTGLASCSSAPQLTVPPLALTSFGDLTPLGNLNPTGHVFPTDHLYFYLSTPPAAPVPATVVAPGDITIASVESSTRTSGTDVHTDYSVHFFACQDVDFYFGHVAVLSPALAAAVGTINGNCQTYTTGNTLNTQCYKSVSIRLRAGDVVGTVGAPGQWALDFGAYDRRVPPLAFVNPDRAYGGSGFGLLTTVCPVDYFEPAVRDALRARLGGRGLRRVAAPVCGTIMQDVAGTAQGRWFDGPSPQEDPHLALVHDNVDPTLGAFSIGTSIPSIPPGTYLFVPAASGHVNRDFHDVTPDGQTYCYETSVFLRRTILLQLLTATRVRIDGMTAPTCGDPSTWSFSAAAVEFVR
jgi:hypothetical protein